MRTLLLIDGMSNAYRAFYAIRGMTDSRGRPTNAVFGFIRILLKIIGEYRPDYLAIAGDARGPTFRHDAFEDYKAHRKPMPADLAGQIPLIKEVASAYRIPWIEIPGYEADDILATLARKAAAEGLKIFILTGDKDLLQLVDEKIKVISPHKDGILFDRAAVEERYGLPPEQLGDILALMGDKSDNVPGVPGIGEKTAVKLLRRYQSLEEVLRNASETKNKRVRENLKTHADQARLSRELVKLDDSVPLDQRIDQLRYRPPDQKRLRDIFTRLEFKNMLRRIMPEADCEITRHKITGPKSGDLISRIRKGKQMALDIQAGPGRFMKALPAAISICLAPGEAFSAFLDTDDRDEPVLESLREILEDETILKYVHGLKQVTHLLLNRGIALKGAVWDSVLASYLLDPARPDHSLATLSWEYLSEGLLDPEAKEEIKEIDTIPSALARRVEIIFRLKMKMEDELTERQLLDLLLEMEIPLTAVLVEMERNGIAVSRSRLKEFSDYIESELEGLREAMFRLAGEEFNLNSPQQLQNILFTKLKLTPKKKIKTGYSTDMSVLKQLTEEHELPALILRYRGLYKLKSTYIDPLPDLINEETGRIHTTFNQAVTATGRLSSSSPNLQNIPIRSKLGRRIRQAFLPSPSDWLFFSADYSQIDLRILAHLSRDPLLLEAFSADRDIHAFTASQIFGVELEDVTPEMRRRAKTVNFGIIYGMAPYGLSRDLNISYQQAREFIEAYFDRYRGVDNYIKKSIAEAADRGYVTTLFGRRRYIPELKSDQENIRAFGERTAINTPIQGSASDIIKLAMIKISRELKAEKSRARLLLQIHDELLFEAPEAEIEPLRAMVCPAMEGVMELSVDLKTDIKVGSTWRDMVALKA